MLQAWLTIMIRFSFADTPFLNEASCDKQCKEPFVRDGPKEFLLFIFHKLRKAQRSSVGVNEPVFSLEMTTGKETIFIIF